MSTDRIWTEARIRAYGLRMPTFEAIEAVYGARPTKARKMIQNGHNLGGMRVLQLGTHRVTPTVDVLRLLGLDEHAPDLPPPNQPSQPTRPRESAGRGRRTSDSGVATGHPMTTDDLAAAAVHALLALADAVHDHQRSG